MSKQVDWNNVISAVATAEGLLVTERGVNGQVGAPPYLVARGMENWGLRPLPGRQQNAPQPGSQNMSAGPNVYRQWTCSRWVKNPMYTGIPPIPLKSSDYEWTCQLKKTWQGSQGIVISGYQIADESTPYFQQICDRIEKRVGIPGNYTWEPVLTTCLDVP